MKRILIALSAALFSIGLMAGNMGHKDLTAHPRLLLTAGEEALIKEAVHEEDVFRRIHYTILAESDRLLQEPVLRHELRGFRLLKVSREAFRRIFYLSWSYRMTGFGEYERRAQEEMRAVCRFKDWNPQHFLDVGEMTLAVAIGYDWLYDRISPEDRRLYQDAILTKGFKPSYDERWNGFLTRVNNWNQVCNAGLTFGALALLGEDSTLDGQCRDIIERALGTIGTSMATYAPDGNYPEGYNYWGYGTTLNAMMAAALESSLGTDGGLSEMPGFLKSAEFMLYLTGTTGLPFNYSDCDLQPHCFPIQFWFAHKTGNPSLLWNELQFLKDPDSTITDEEARFLPLALIYGSKVDITRANEPVEKMWTGRGRCPMMIIRTGWKDGDGMYLATKGGRPRSDHAHMDGGAFLFEAGGVRWAEDLGVQSYETFEKAGLNQWDYRPDGERWKIFRYTNHVHNTLSIKDRLHDADGAAELLETFEDGENRGGSYDLTSLLGAPVRKAVRTYRLSDSVLKITDRVQAGEEDVRMEWVMTTSAEAVVKEGGLELMKDGRKLYMKISGGPYEVTVVENTPPAAYDAPNPGSRRILIGFPVGKGSVNELSVSLFLESELD